MGTTGLRKSYPGLKREMRLIKSNLRVAKKMPLDIKDNTVAKYLREKGYINKEGRITEKGKKAERIL